MGSTQPGGRSEDSESTTSRVEDPARWLRRKMRGGIFSLVSRWLPRPEQKPLPDLSKLERILLVHVNQRIGNTILVTPGLSELMAHLRHARVDFVGGPHAPAILEGFGFRRIEVVGRSDIVRMWRLLGVARRLRAERYDAAIHLGTTSRSVGPSLTGLSGATYRIGRQRQRDRGGVFFTTPIVRARARHKVDVALEFLAALGVPARGERRMLLRADEIAAAEDTLRTRIGDDAARPVAFFVGGRARKGKDWPLESFGGVAKGLRARDIPVVVLLGPEEKEREAEIRSAIGEAVYFEGGTVRSAAAIVRCCGAVLTPDAGPMHLALAAGAPTAAVFRKSNHDRWGPRPPFGEVVYDPDGSGVEPALETLLRLYDAHAAAEAQPSHRARDVGADALAD